MIYNLPWLIDQYDRNEKLKYIFFWGHQKSKDGPPTKSCFSQWWVSPFTVEQIRYRTAEHWMMAEKARLFEDEEVLDKILKCNSPGEAKQLGREVRNFDLKTWDLHKYEIVIEGNCQKFSQNVDLAKFLIATHDRVLVEASPYDRIWGIGLSEQAPNIDNPYTWKGQNLLGFALMEVRDRLESEKPN